MRFLFIRLGVSPRASGLTLGLALKADAGVFQSLGIGEEIVVGPDPAGGIDSQGKPYPGGCYCRRNADGQGCCRCLRTRLTGDRWKFELLQASVLRNDVSFSVEDFDQQGDFGRQVDLALGPRR